MMRTVFIDLSWGIFGALKCCGDAPSGRFPGEQMYSKIQCESVNVWKYGNVLGKITENDGEITLERAMAGVYFYRANRQ